jgi:hypothetical protein
MNQSQSQGSGYASKQAFLPEWDDSDGEWDMNHDLVATPLGPTKATIRNTSTPKEVKIHPHPHSHNHSSHSHSRDNKSQHHVMSSKTASPRRSRYDDTRQQNHPGYNHVSAEGNHNSSSRSGNGSEHNNEIMMFREKLLQSVESVQCINDTLDSVCEYINSERTIDEKVLYMVYIISIMLL